MPRDKKPKLIRFCAICWLSLSSMILLSFSASSRGSELTKGRKALFAEDFELDVYEFTVTEKGAAKDEDPRLIRAEDAYQGNNVLLLSGKKGVLTLELTRKVKGLVEMQLKFPPPRDYTRMIAVGLGDQEIMLGVNRSDKFAYVVGGQWKTSRIPVTGGWHTFTFDYSGGFTKAYIDGTLVATDPQGADELNRVRLGVNNGRGGRCMVDKLVVYDTQAGLAADDTVEVQIPLLDWEHELELGAEREQHYEDATYRITDDRAHSGRYAAEIAIQPLDKSQWRYCHFHRKPLLPGLPRKLSVWVHGDGTGAEFRIQFLTPNSNVNYDLGKIDWSGWKRLELDLTQRATGFYPPKSDWVIKDASNENTMIMSWWLRPPAGKATTVTIDDVVLTTRLSKVLPYVLYAESTAEDGVIESGKSADFRVLVTNGSKQDKTFVVDYSLQDYWGNTVRRGSREIAVEGGRYGVAEINTGNPLPSGWYSARFILALNGKAITNFKESIAVLRPLPATVFCQENPLGHYGGPNRQTLKAGLSDVYVGVDNGDIRKLPAEKLRRAHIRENDLNMLKKHNLTGVLLYYAPPWAFLPDDEMDTAAQEWADAFAEFAAAHKGLPIFYKILSEPNNVGISPERCYSVLKYAHEGITRGDPDAKIIGLNTSKFDWGRQKVVWSKGGLNYVHGVGVHPYCGARHGSAKPERVHGIGNLMNMLRLDDMIRRYNQGEPKPLWASEVGYDTSPGEPHAVTIREQADYMARMVIEFKTMDNFRNVHYHMFRDRSTESWQWGFFNFHNRPKPLAVAFHTLAERMTGASWLKSLATPDNVRAYLFAQPDGKQMLAAWSVDGPDKFSVPVQCAAVELMDLMGVYHDIEVKAGTLQLELTESPVFITPKEGALLIDRWVQAITRYREVFPGLNGKELTVKVRNDSDQPLRGTLLCDPPEGLVLDPASHQVELDAGVERDFLFKLSVDSDCPVKLCSLTFQLQSEPALPAGLADSKAMISAVYPDIQMKAEPVNEAPVLDGKLEDAAWSKARQITEFLDQSGFPTDRRQSLRLLYDTKGLYLGLWSEKMPGEALLAEHTQRDDPNLWQDECIEIFLDPNLDRNNYFQFVANLKGVQTDYKFVDTKRTKRDWKQAIKWNAGWKVAGFETDDHWSAEVFIPWADIGVVAGKAYKMGLNVSRTHAVVGDSKHRAYTPGGVPNHAVESYMPLEVDLKGQVGK